MKDVNYLKSNGIDVDASLEILGDISMYDETMGDFLEESSTRIPDIINYKNSGDMENYAILVHAMKGDSKYLGFTKLADLSYNHQIESQNNNVNYVNDNFDELMEEANRIIGICNTYLGK